MLDAITRHYAKMEAAIWWLAIKWPAIRFLGISWHLTLLVSVVL
jgi:hypothetical protein